jgi:hypothetical protein
MLGAAALLSFAATAGPARAGDVTISSCGSLSASDPGADDAWHTIIQDLSAYSPAPVACPPDGTQFSGRGVWTTLRSGVAATAPAGAELRFTAPAGTTISQVRIQRDLGLSDDGYYVFGRTDSAQLSGESCARPAGEFTCDVGGPGTPNATFGGLSAAWVAWGFRCGANAFVNCGTGITFHQAWATIYASTVTLADNQAPANVNAGGSIVTGGWHSGTVDATATATDNLGIRMIRWYADGTPIAGAANTLTRECDFSTPIPCTAANATATSLDTTALLDGTRSVQLAVVDPAGNETRSSAFALKVDNTVPATPGGLVVTGGGSSSSFGLSWITPAPDGGAPLTTVRWQACAGSTCASGSTPAVAGPQSLTGLTLPSAGTYAVRVWAVDAAGNGNAGSGSVGGVSYAPPGGGGGGGDGGGDGGGGGGGTGGGSGTGANGPGGAGATGPGGAGAGEFGGAGAGAAPGAAGDGAARPSDGGAAPGSVPGAGEPPATRRVVSARLRIDAARFSPRTGRLRIGGRIDARAAGTVRVDVRGKIGGRWRTRRVIARVRRGRYSVSLSLTGAWRSATALEVRARFGGSPGVASGSRGRRVRRDAP